MRCKLAWNLVRLCASGWSLCHPLEAEQTYVRNFWDVLASTLKAAAITGLRENEEPPESCTVRPCSRCGSVQSTASESCASCSPDAASSDSAQRDISENARPTGQPVADTRYDGRSEHPRSGRPDEPWQLLSKLDLTRLAELHGWFTCAEETVDALQIREFVKLVPTKAHRALAWLYLEGGIEEIITTNYDTCVERAVDDARRDDKQGAVRTIVRFDELADPPVLEGRRVLRLYKLNGCAARLREDKDAERILLTNLQLQGYRNERWAALLLQDRLSRGQLLFSGFGSEDPQVRHTALTLVHEIRSMHGEGVKLKRPAHFDHQRVAPFIHAHEQGLSFAQWQIARAFSRSGAERGWRRLDDVLANTFTGRDAHLFRPGQSRPPTLPADDFWETVYAGWLYRKAKRLLLGIVNPARASCLDANSPNPAAAAPEPAEEEADSNADTDRSRAISQALDRIFGIQPEAPVPRLPPAPLEFQSDNLVVPAWIAIVDSLLAGNSDSFKYHRFDDVGEITTLLLLLCGLLDYTFELKCDEQMARLTCPRGEDKTTRPGEDVCIIGEERSQHAEYDGAVVVVCCQTVEEARSLRRREPRSAKHDWSTAREVLRDAVKFTGHDLAEGLRLALWQARSRGAS